MSAIIHKGWQIEVDEDGHITVWDSEGCTHWTEATVEDAKAAIDRVTAPAPMVGLLLLDARQQMIQGGPR